MTERYLYIKHSATKRNLSVCLQFLFFAVALVALSSFTCAEPEPQRDEEADVVRGGTRLTAKLIKSAGGSAAAAASAGANKPAVQKAAKTGKAGKTGKPGKKSAKKTKTATAAPAQ
jgi:hypothetical protein